MTRVSVINLLTNGGLNLIDLETHIKAQRLSWIPQVKLLLIKQNSASAGLSKLSSNMVLIFRPCEVKSVRQSDRWLESCFYSTFSVFQGLQLHHLTLKSIGRSSRKKSVGSI